ncbi:MAG: hypothetical protein IPF99_30410 [Deltaproteobacteria bacterium]|nr:hypothetical protein [Deltaproteobacteria bacterium]
MRRSPLHLAFGLFGVASVATGLLVSWRVGTSPGDDNPIGMVAVAAALLGLVPSWRLVLWARGRGLREHLIWLFCAGVVSLPLALCVAVLVTVLWS